MDDTYGKMKVLTALESLPGIGKARARRLMKTVGISDARRLHALSAKQRGALLSAAEHPARKGNEMQTSLKNLVRRDMRKLFPSAPPDHLRQATLVALGAMESVLETGHANPAVAIAAGHQIRDLVGVQAQRAMHSQRGIPAH